VKKSKHHNRQQTDKNVGKDKGRKEKPAPPGPVDSNKKKNHQKLGREGWKERFLSTKDGGRPKAAQGPQVFLNPRTGKPKQKGGGGKK